MADVEGIPALRRRLAAIGDTRLLLGKVALLGVRDAKALVPRRTGNLGRTIRVGRVTKTDAEVLAGGRLKVGYAAFVEFGTRPHVIRPRTARVLAWGGPRTLGGRLRSGARPTNFARRVRHPGTRPHPYLVPGVRSALQKAGLREGIIKSWNDAA